MKSYFKSKLFGSHLFAAGIFAGVGTSVVVVTLFSDRFETVGSDNRRFPTIGGDGSRFETVGSDNRRLPTQGY